jgi:hypothetical protein
MPFSDSEMKCLEVDGVTGDEAKHKILPREMCQSATARFLAFYRLCGTEKIANPAVEDKIQTKRNIRK